VALVRKKFGFQLNYDPPSLIVIDLLVDKIKETGATEHQASGLLLGLGCYVGEVFVRNARGSWRATAEMGIDCMTSGNHIWDKREIIPVIDNIPQLLRPANYPEGQPGKGSYVGRGKDSRVAVATLNLSGRIFMNGSIDDPFAMAAREVEALRKQAAVIIVDMHAEATSEKVALGYYLDGKVSAVVGTHTHVPTCDHRLLPKGTAYCSDLGMTGPYDSVIGVEAPTIIQRFLTGMPGRFETAKGDPRLAAVVVEVEEKTGRARASDRMLLTEADVGALA
jgi:metallophosphoesterase (TIGR00282 family)